MATETYIPEFVSISKGEGEEKNLTSVQLDATADENYPGELKKVEGALNDPSEIFEYSEKTKNMQAANNIGIETVSTVNKGHVGTSEGESFLESPSVSEVANEETGRVSEHYQAGEIPNQAEKEIFREETKLHKYKKLEGAEEAGEENEGMEEIKEGEEKLAKELRETASHTNPAPIQRALGETGFGGGEDKESEKSSISMHMENDPEADEKEHESDERKKIPSDGTRDVIMTTVAASTAETTLQEAGITFQEKIQDTIVLHEKVKDVILVEGEIQDQNKLDTPFVEQTKDLGLLKVDKPETLKEVSESGTDMREIPYEKNLPQVDLNEKIESGEAAILNKNSNVLLVSYPSVEEAVQVEGDKLDGISKFEPQEQVHETNGVPLEEKKNFEEATESLILEPTSTEGEKASNSYAEALDYGLDTEKESKEKYVGQNIEEEIQKKEEACDPEMHKSATRSIDAEKGKTDEDVSATNEIIKKSFQVDYLDEAPSTLTSEGKSDKAKDDDEKDTFIPEEVHDEITITGTMEGTRELIAGEDDVTEGLPESIGEEKVKSFPDNEKVLLADEKSRGQDNKEQAIADDVKGTPESIKEENFADNENGDEKCRAEIFESSEMTRVGEYVENEKILDTSMVKPKESLLGEGENQVPIDASTEEKKDEHSYSVMDEDNDDNTGLVEVQSDVKDETSIVKENTGWISQKDETGEQLEQSLTEMSKVTERINSSENTEKITIIEEERAIQDIEETFEKEEKKDTKHSEERGTASEEDLKSVAVESEMNKSTESADLELKSEKGEMEVEKLEIGNELGSEERFKGNDEREEIEEEIKKEETYADLHKVETTCDDTEKSKIAEDALIKDASTVWIGEEIVELRCQEDKDGRNSRGKAALELNGGDHNVRTDNGTKSLTDQIISEEIAAISQGTEKHTIKEEQTTIDISPQSSREETHKSPQEDETKDEEPKVEICEGLETTTVGEGIEGHILEGDTIQGHSTAPTEVEETEDISKYNEMMAKMPDPEVCETLAACQDRSTEFIEKDTESPQEDKVCKESEMAVTSMETEKQEIEIHAIPDLSFSAFGGEMVKESSAQDFEGSTKKCTVVEQVEVELETEAQCIGSEVSDTKTNSGPTEENKTSVDPGEKLEGAPESVAKDQSNETFLEMNQTQDKENSSNVQDQKSESVVEEQNIEQGLQEDVSNKYEETTSGSDACDHEIQNENETTSERTVDFSHSISEISEEISKPIIQEAETCCSKLDTASKKVETEATCPWEAQPDEKPLKGTESTSEEKTITTAEISPQGKEGECMKLEEATEFMSQLPAIPGENADKESSTMEKSHVDEVEETKGDSETVSESKQCVEEIDGTQKSLTVEESEGIIKEEIKGPSETASECNYQVIEAVIEDEVDVVQTATTRESEEQHQETSKASLPKEQDDGIIATIRNLEDGKAEEGATTQNENLEDSFATRTSEEICLHKEEPRELESGLVIKLDENIQNISPDEPPKEECITLYEVSQLEPQENVSAIKCSDSPTERDKVMGLSEEVIEEAEKTAEESEDIKEQSTEKDRDVKECLAVSPEDELVNKVQHSETILDENSRATDSEVQIEQVNLGVMEDFSKDHEGSSITKAVEEEMLQKHGSERKVDVSSFVSEISEGINKEVIEDTDICFNNIDTSSEKVETEDTRLREAQLDDKHIKTIETGSDDKTLQTNTTPEISPQSEVDSVKLEETPKGVSQCPVIACEITEKESEIVEKPHMDDAEEIKGADVEEIKGTDFEEIKGAPESVSEFREQQVEGNDEIQKNLIVEESEEDIIKEEIEGSSETRSRCNYQGIEVVIEDEVNVVHTATEGQHQETSKALLSEEQDHGITTTTGHLEDGKAEEGETPQNEDLEDSFGTGTTEEICLQKEESREFENFGLGLELNENMQNVNPNEPPQEECITLDEVSELELQENISTIKCSDSPTESDKVTELPAEVPEGAEKAAEESENIKELIIEKETDVKECPAVSNEDESVKKAQYSETVSDDNPRAIDSDVRTEKMNQEIVENFSYDSDRSPTTKAMGEEMLQKQGSGKKVDVYSCVSEISEAINKEVIEYTYTCSNNSDTASQKVEMEETRLREAQMDDKHIKITETSSEDVILQTNITIETSPQCEEVDNIKLEETPEGVSQLPDITCENTDESENVEKPQADEVGEVKGAEIVSESREQFSEENDGIPKSLTVEESESIIKEEIRGSSKTVSGCNDEGVGAVVEDEMDVSQIATTRKSEEQHQETSRALLSEEQDRGIKSTIGSSQDGKIEEVGTPQNENLEDSKTTEETCLQKEEPRDLEISGVGIKLSENIQNINPNEPPKEECVTLDEVSQLEPQRNVSAIKCSDSPTKSDKVMEFSEEVLEGVEKAAEESEDIKKLIIEKEINVKECPAISIGDESVNKVLHSEIVSDENTRSTDSEVQAENVNLQVVKDFSNDPEGSPITKAMEEEMLRKQGSETSPHDEEVDSIKHEGTPEVVSQLPAIAYENKDESEPVEKPHTDEVEKVKEASSAVYECKEQCAEEFDETQKSQIVEGPEKGIGKEVIKGPSETVSVCNYEGVYVVIEDEINVVQAATTAKSEESHHETSTVLLFEERDHGITTTIGHSEDGIAKEDGAPPNEGLEDSFSTKTEVCSQKKEPRELEISGLGLEVNEDVQKNKTNELPKEECITPDEGSQLEPQENVSEIKCIDPPMECDKIIKPVRSIDSTLQEAYENLDSRISNNRADDDLPPHLAGEEILQEVDKNCDKTSNIECEKIEKASAVVFEAHSNVIEKTAFELEAGAYNHGSEASSLKTIDSLTEEALEEAEKAAESENIKKLIIEKEAESEEPAIEDESANKVQHSDTVTSENLGATDPNIQTEKANLDVVEDFSQELEGTPIEKALEEGKLQIQGSATTVDISSFVSEISAETAKEVVEDSDACHDKLDTAYEKVETEETSLQEAQLNDKHMKIIETSSEDKKLQTNTTIETSPQGEEGDGVKIEETSTLVSQLPVIACENANMESETVEKSARDEVEETKGASDIESDSKEQQVEAIDETKENPTVEESKDLFTEEIKGPSETVSQSKYQGGEEIYEEKIIVVETAIAGKSEKLDQETSDSLLYEEQDHGSSITIGYSEDGKTKEDETLQNENIEDSCVTKKEDYMHLQKEECRELEISELGLELNENIQSNNLNELPKEECGTIDEVSPLDAQENVSLVKCTNSPVESDKVMELTNEVPEEAVERENIKELIIEKEREIKELPAVSIDESVNKVQFLEPVSSENLGVTDPNMQTENLIVEVEDLSKEPEGSPITKALEEEVSEKQNDQKAMDVPSSVSEMNENIKEEIVEKADISYGKLHTESEKGEPEKSSLQDAQLDDKPLEIIETSSEDKTLQTNTTTETSQHTEEDDSMKLKETLELVSQGPANGCESTNKESETVEKPNADELEETTGASNTVPQLKEQCAEEIDEMESELKYRSIEAVIEEEIIAGQSIKAEVPGEQLEEVSTAILSEEQEHVIHTTIGKSEDENIKEGATGQYKNPEDSFGTKTSQEICLQKEEPRELDVSVPKEDGNIVDGVSRYELQENASELKCTDSPLGSEKVMEQTRSIGSTHQEATKDDENLDSGVVNSNPDALTHSPGEEISQEEGEKCEEASNLEYERYEKASEHVSDLESAAIDEAVVGLEVGAHIHGSDASNNKNSENLREEGAEEAVESENIKELIIETERDIKDLPAAAIEVGTVNKVQHAEAVSNENLTAINSNTETEIMNSEVAEYLSKDPEGSPVSETLQEEISQKQASEKTVEATISVSEMSEESFNEETIKEANFCCSKLAPEKVVTGETILQEGQLDDKPLRDLDTSVAEKTLSTNTTTESSLQGEEVDSMKVEETSELMSRFPTIACESADKEGKTVERSHVDDVEEPRGTSDTVSESREQCVENFVEIQESLTLANSEENIVEEIKGPADGASECTYQSFEEATENEAAADQTIEAEKPEEQLQEMSAALVSEEQEHGISTIASKLEDENTVENETPQYENPQDSFGTKMTVERCLHKEESRDLEVYELELDNDVQKKTSSEEPKEGGNTPYGITPLEPQEDAFEIKCTDPLAESGMELTRSMDSTLQEASKDDEDLDSGISIKNVNDVLPPCSSGQEILQEVDENSEEASNLEGGEGKEIEKASESTFQVQSAEVDKAAIELEAGSHSHGSEPSSVENNNNPTEKNIELAELGEKLGGRPELVAEDQCNETLLDKNQAQVNGNRRSAWEQNTKSIEEKFTGQEGREKETIEETEGKLEFRDHINIVQNENVTTKDVISVEEVPEEAEIAEENENIQEQIIEEKRDTKELAAVSIEDKTVDKVQHSEPVSCESYRATESNKETKEVNLEDEAGPCEKQDVSSSVFELSEKGFKGETLDEADNDNKLDTACEKEEAEKTILQEPQLDDEPLKGTETILEEKIPSIINTTETSPGDEEAEAVKREKTSDLVSQLPTTTYEHADKERIIVGKPQADEVEETKIASDAVSESKDPCVEEIDKTQRSLTMEKLEEDIIEEEMTGRSRTVSACNQCVEAIFQDEITRESPETEKSEEQLQEMSTPLLPEEEHADKNPQKENLEDSLGTESVEEISLKKEGLRELEVSALAPKLSDVIQKETPNEVLKDEGQPQENAPEIKYMGSTTGSEEVMKLTRSINSSSQETLKKEEILDSESSNNKDDDFSITHPSGEILRQMQEQCEKTPILECQKIEKASESVPEIHYPEAIIKLEETEVKEEHLKTSVAEMKTEEIPHEKKIEANEIVKNEISNEEIAEEKQVVKDYQPESLDKETIRKSQQGDELKNESEHEELSEGSKKGEAKENIGKQIIDEARTVENPPLVSFRDESVKDDLPEAAKEERNDKETDIKLDLVNQSDETAQSEQADCSDIQLVKKDPNIADAHDDLKPNLDVQPATRAVAEEASHQKEGDRIRVSESVPKEPVLETIRCNEEIATAITDYSENIMEDKMHTHTPCELACNEHYASEGLNLKDIEVNTNENCTSPFSETSWEEIPDKESVISEAERQHDLTSGEQTIAASMPTEEKGAIDEVVQAKDEDTKDEEPIEFSARGSEGKVEDAETHSTTCHKDGEIQDQIDKLNASSEVQDSCMEISEKEVNMVLAEANESTQDTKKLEKGSDETSQKCVPREAEPNESTEVTISSSKEEVQPIPKNLQPEVGSLESVNVSWIESGVGAKDLGGEKTVGDISKEPAVDPTPLGPAVSFSDLLQRSIKETLQAPGCLTEEKEQMINKEDALAKEEEGSDVQEAETHEDRDQEEEGDGHNKDDSGSDAPIIVEASRDMNAKDGHKKSHNILSGVGSKVKHSIAKVKKAITGKSSHQKHSSPKGTATKVKEQK